MMEARKTWFKTALVSVALLLSILSYGQESSANTTPLGVKKALPNLNQPFFVLNQKEIAPFLPASIMHQNAVFNADELPIFCKIEHLLGLRSQFPVKIRLGDVDYVDNLESK